MLIFVRLGFILTLFLNAAYGQDNSFKSSNTCGDLTCKGGGKFQYKPGLQHVYKYYVDMKSLFQGTSTNQSTLFIEAQVLLDFISECDGLLSFSNVKLSENINFYEEADYDEQDPRLHENMEAFSNDLSRFSLRFGFQDGIITELCPNEEESIWTLNFKRGLLSMIHNTMRRFDLDHVTVEDDVHGSCDTLYRVKGTNGTSLLIEKSKNLNSCLSSSKFNSFLQSSTYKFNSNYHNENLMKSSSDCEISVDHHIVNEIKCEETHVFQPFSNKAAGATTIVKQIFVLQEEVTLNLEEQPSISRRTSLLYNRFDTPKLMSGELKASRDLLMQLCRLDADIAQVEISDVFTKFVYSLRILSPVALSVLYSHVGTFCLNGKQYILDALPYINTAASVSLMKDITLNFGVNNDTLHDWMTSIAFISYPNEEILKSAATLLENRKNDSSVVLSVAALTHTFCVQNADYHLNEQVNNIVNMLQNVVIDLYSSKSLERAVQESIIVSLKALSNIGFTTEAFKEDLFQFIADDNLDIGIRVVAIEVFRRFSCEEVRARFEQIFKDSDQDAEIRIASYLQIMRCPNYMVIAGIRNSLLVEEVNQVGSFIWSHLHNLMKSSSPNQVEIQSLLSDTDLVKKFSSDIRKFSQNFEGSFFSQDFNIGASYENNVIFSTSSYFPRSANLNMSVHLFGETINLFEIGGRVEGFEHYLEGIFGPKGSFNSKAVQKKFPKLRFPRNVDESEHSTHEIDDLPSIITNNFNKPKVSLGLKIFGNELKYSTFEGEKELVSALQYFNVAEHLKKIFSGNEINYKKTTMFLDSKYIVPSGAGLPITLSAVGTSSINVKLYGSLQAANFLKTKTLDLNGNIHPSAAVNIIGTMSVDAYYASTAIKLKTSMHTSSAIEGSLKIRGADLISLKFSLPKEHNEIFAAHSELAVVKNHMELLERGIDNSISESVCSWPVIESTVGLKLCAHYNFPNVTSNASHPFFILAGPTEYKVSLLKMDISASNYLFEYKWTKTDSGSIISLIYDTPDAAFHRIFGVNLTLNTQNQDLTLLLHSSVGTLLARGKYRNTETEKSLQLVLDIDDKKHLDASISLERRDSRYGYTYVPKLYLGVNGERVAEFQGTLKWVTKKGISQCDVDLKFQTKRLISKVFGYISKSDASIGTNLKLDYKFLNTREQRVIVQFSLANRSTRTIVAVVGNARLDSTAYPNFNFDTALKFQRAAGRMECRIELNNGEHLEKLNPNRIAMIFELKHKTKQDGSSFDISFSVNRTRTDLDMGGAFSYYVTGPKTDITIKSKYASEKEIVVTVFWTRPRGLLKHYEGLVSVSVPSYTPFNFGWKIHEKHHLDYDVEFSAAWFTGQFVTAVGIYQDRSISKASYYHLKLAVKSPNFEDLDLDFVFYRDDNETKIDFKANYERQEYGLFCKHTVITPYDTSSQIRLIYQGKVYSLSSSVELHKQKQIVLEIHVDQIRDIQLLLWSDNRENKITGGLDIKWDANRDPNQKLVLTTSFENSEPYNYDTNFVVAFPGRTINGIFTSIVQENHLSTLIHLAWSPSETISLQLSANYRNQPETEIDIKSTVVTPFEKWSKTSLNIEYKHVDNMYKANGTLRWQGNQYVSADIFKDYAISSILSRYEFSSAILSSFESFPSFNTIFKHSYNATKVDTILYISYKPKQIISAKSSWYVTEDTIGKNLTGTVTLVSPFVGYSRGLFAGKIHMSKKHDIRGVAELDLDHSKYMASVEGHFQKISSSMLVFNISTPIERFNKLSGRLGFLDDQKHLAAFVQHPTGTNGIEIKFLINSLTDFDIKFFLGTPMEFLQNVLVIGYLKPHMVDFKIAVNLLLTGFSGVWRSSSITDFEYLFKLYTPIVGLEENGVVAKLIYKDGLDFEVSGKLADGKVGLVVVGKSKPAILNEMGIKTQSLYNRNLAPVENDQDDIDNEDDYDEEIEEPINWSGLIELDMLLYPTIKGTLDVEQKGNMYVIVSTFTLPNGMAELKDEFIFIDYLTMQNKLHLTLPYPNYKIITTNYDLQVIVGQQLGLSIDVNYLNDSNWINTGGSVHYSIMEEGFEQINITRALTLHIHTPYTILPQLNLQSTLRTEENFYGLKLFLNMNTSEIAFEGNSKIGDGLLTANLSTHVTCPLIVIPPLTFSLKKNFTSTEKRIDIFFDMLRSKPSKFDIVVLWEFESIANFKVKADIVTPIRSLEKIEFGILVSMLNNNGEGKLLLLLHPLNVNANATIQDNHLISYITYEFKKARQEIMLDYTLLDSSASIKEIQGTLKVGQTLYAITGSMEFSEMSIPEKVSIHIKGNENMPFVIQYHIRPQAGGQYVTAGLIQGDQFINLEVHTSTVHPDQLNAHLKISTSNKQYTSFEIDSQIMSHEIQKSIAIKAQTPFQDIGNPSITISLNKASMPHVLQVFYHLKHAKGNLHGEWSWLWMENMFFKITSTHEAVNSTKNANVHLFYFNPNKTFNALQLGGDVNLNGATMAKAEANISIVNIQNLKVGTFISLPNFDVYVTNAMFYSNKEWNNIEYFIKHLQKNSARKYGSSGKIVTNPGHFNGDVNLDWNNQYVNNHLNWKHSDHELNLQYSLQTPKFNNMDTFSTNVMFTTVSDNYHHIKSQAFYPGNTSVFHTAVDYKEFGNMNGSINIAIPFKILKNFGSNFKTETNKNTYNHYLNVFWPTNSAFIDSKCTVTTRSSVLEKDLSGVFLIEVPLTTKHTGKVDYSYSVRPEKTTGWATAYYKKDKILDGKYSSLSESRAGYDKNTISLQMENQYLPIGILYIHGNEYNAPNDEINPTTKDLKRLEAYHLHNTNGFNMTGEMVLRTTSTGKEMILTAIHANRTVKLWTDYDLLDQQLKQHTKLELEPNVWIGYDISIVNKTLNEDIEAQTIQIDISYPRRNFTVVGSYNISDISWACDTALTWDKQKKTLAAMLDWKQNPSTESNHQQIEFQLKHPSFEKDISFLGEYQSDGIAIADVRLTVDYSKNADQKLELKAMLENLSTKDISNYSCTITGKHPATNLHLYSYGGVSWRSKWYYISQQLDYKRTYLPMQSREALGMVDFHNYELELKKKSLRDLTYFWSKFAGKYPSYTVNISAVHGNDINSTGKFYLNLKEKVTRFDLNITEDGSETFQMFGSIPDARGAIFDIWRKYEDLTISDISFFLRLNHSRLIVSRLHWRPEIKQQLQRNFQEASSQIYKDFLDNIDYWRQYIRSEVTDAIADVWQDSKPLVEEFLANLRDLKTIENDIEDLKNYLNQSYNANEFYVRDIVSFGVHLIDELALKSHIESLPQIVNELWEVMGESGQKIRKGIVWVIDTIKTHYKHAMQFINDISQGNPFERISQILSELVVKYDTFMKELHLSIIRYIENLWKQAIYMAVENWHKFLAIMQPTFLKLLHLSERLIWDTSKDFLDFLYVQKRELLASPYFGKFSNLSYDIDKIYKDITKNSVIASVYKYTMVVWNFLNDKLFKLVPFGKEFHDIVIEVVNELKELKKLPAFKDLVDKETEIYEKMKWFYNYFSIDKKFENLLSFVQFKLMDLTRTALEVDNRYREAKTKFIFEPNEGIIYMEQKLPISWHAFNETPKFQEIPEYNAINDVQKYFETSKTTFWSLYYDYKPYMDPSEWFPPFKAQALVAASRYYVTFDRTYYTFSGSCPYLLAADFIDHNFTVVISYDDKLLKANELLLFVENTTIHINIVKSSIQLNSTTQSRLPLELRDLVIYQESDIVTVESASGFTLQCNLKFEICIFELSGWYFGKTAGLFGTMNNEHSDDLLTSYKKKVNVSDVSTFAKSWIIGKQCLDQDRSIVIPPDPSDTITGICESFFTSSISPLATCFARVKKQPFLDMCLHSSSERETCTSAVAYMKLCALENTPLRIPDACVKCTTLNGTVVSEGEFVRFEGESVPKSADIVFIVEAKECNRDLRTNLTFDSITDLLHKELSALNITQNRYSVVVFGGNGVFDKPRSVAINSRIFTNHNGINSYLDNIPVGKGNADIFAAIVFATKLIFRPGVSKTFVLLPCTDCHESNMKLDYPIIHQLLLENDITLHILMNDDFILQKDKINKIFYGIDRAHAYTKRDVKELKGDSTLLKQVRLPKSTLGFCTALALETNGSLFTLKKLEADKKSPVKRFATVFGKRIAYSAKPSKCQMCECTSPNTGVSFMECFPCNYPTPVTTEYEFNEDETLTILQPPIEDEDVEYT